MDRASDKHSPRVDEELKHETEGLVRSGRDTRAEEWRSPEPPGEDQPGADLDPAGALHGGLPAGMTDADVEGRAELAGYLGRSSYPATAGELADRARAAEAPDHVLAELDRLDRTRRYASVGEVWVDLGGHTEAHRF